MARAPVEDARSSALCHTGDRVELAEAKGRLAPFGTHTVGESLGAWTIPDISPYSERTIA